ncbi:MAG: family 2 glycosyl transferase [Actinomycetota bacterium]|nr:MAG: family 2 glycosyl transferase [Actinomycetota bacterium]
MTTDLDSGPGRPDVVPDEDAPAVGDSIPRRRHHVTAVIVSHDGARWLPAVLATVAAQTRPAELVVGVDTGSHDNSGLLLRSALGDDHVGSAPRDTSYGAALARGLALADGLLASDASQSLRGNDIGDHDEAGHDGGGDGNDDDGNDDDGWRPGTGEPIRWLWFLHDDSAPALDALDELLLTSDSSPGTTVLGPKVRGWYDRRLLLECGVSISTSGRRDTGLEWREHDQGQHDTVRDVLAVGSAGMLVRRDVWDRLGGFDPALPLFRDDVDFGWRANLSGERVLLAPAAVVHHAEASASARRPLDAAHGSALRRDRASALHVLLAHAPGWRLPLTVVRLVLGTAVRALGLLIAKAPADARDEVVALGDVLADPAAVFASRHRVAAAAPGAYVRHLRPRPATAVRHAVEHLAGLLTTASGGGERSRSGAVETGPVDEAAAYLEDTGSGLLRRTLARPGVLLGLVLTLVSLVAARGLLFADGRLLGGALLPAPDGAADLWRSYTEAWHEVGPGSSAPAPPYLALLGSLAFLLVGRAPLAVDVTLLLAVPLAAVSAFAALRGLVAAPLLRGWMAATYALLPAVTGATSSGRLGTAAFAVLLPPTARMFARVLGLVPAGAKPAGPRTTAGATLLLAAATAFVPGSWLLAVVLGGIAAVVMDPPQVVWRRLVLVLLAAPALLLPWSGELLQHPQLLLLEAGLPGPVDADLDTADVVLLHPGGPGMTPLWLTAGVVVAALFALLRRDRARAVVGAWLVVAVAAGFGTLQTLVTVVPPSSTTAAQPWPGPATLVMGAAMLFAIGVAGQGLVRRLTRTTFGWRQLAVAGIVVLVLAAPVLSAGWLLGGFDPPLRRADPSTVPAFVAADAAGPDLPRTLVLRVAPDGTVGYALLSGAGSVLGDAETGPPASAYRRLDPVVSALAAGRGGDEVAVLSTYAVRYVLLAGAVTAGSDGLVATLDSEPGLRRLSTSAGEALWRVAGTTSRVRLADAAGAATSVPATDSPGAGTFVATTLPPGPAGRRLQLAEATDRRWQVTGDGAGPARTVDGWAQGFAVPAAGGAVTVTYDGRARTWQLLAQLVAVLVVIVLALPGRRREQVDPEAVETAAALAAGPAGMAGAQPDSGAQLKSADEPEPGDELEPDRQAERGSS